MVLPAEPVDAQAQLLRVGHDRPVEPFDPPVGHALRADRQHLREAILVPETNHGVLRRLDADALIVGQQCRLGDALSSESDSVGRGSPQLQTAGVEPRRCQHIGGQSSHPSGFPEDRRNRPLAIGLPSLHELRIRLDCRER